MILFLDVIFIYASKAVYQTNLCLNLILRNDKGTTMENDGLLCDYARLGSDKVLSKKWLWMHKSNITSKHNIMNIHENRHIIKSVLTACVQQPNMRTIADKQLRSCSFPFVA